MKAKKLKNICQAMKRDELLIIVNRLITHAKGDLVSKLVDDYELKVLPSKDSMLSNNRMMIHNLVYAQEGSILIDFAKDIIEIAAYHAGVNSGLVSRDILLHLHSRKHDAGIIPTTGIPKGYLTTLKYLLTVAGFENVKKYSKITKSTVRTWQLREGYSHLSVSEIFELFTKKLKDVNNGNQTP